MRKKKLHTGDLKFLSKGSGWLLVEFGGEDKKESDSIAQKMIDALNKQPNAPTSKLYDDEAQESLVWEIRESGLGATAFVPGEPVTWEGWEDSAVSPEKVGPYLRDFRKLLEKYKYGCAL